MTIPDSISTLVRKCFEDARQSPGTTFQPDRFLAYLTDPASDRGRGVRDTFAGRRRFVRFMEAVQLETGVCFTSEEWERGHGMEEFVSLVAAKADTPAVGARLALKQVTKARGELVATPVKFGILTSPLLLVSVGLSQPLAIVLCSLVWLFITGGTGFYAWRDWNYARRLCERLHGKAI